MEKSEDGLSCRLVVNDPDVYFNQNYVCSSARNYMGYCDKEFDKTVDQQSIVRRSREVRSRSQANMAFPPLADLLIYRDLILAGQARRRIPDAAPTAGASSHHRPPKRAAPR